MVPRVKRGGRKAGTPNKITAQFKHAVQLVYQDIGGHQAFAEWAKENRTDFYRICSKLIPTEAAPRPENRHISISIDCVGGAERGVIEQALELQLIER